MAHLSLNGLRILPDLAGIFIRPGLCHPSRVVSLSGTIDLILTIDRVGRIDMKISITEAISKLPLPSMSAQPGRLWDVEAFRHGSMSLVLYTPEGKDYQTPHEQDELYVVVQGNGVLEVAGDVFSFAEGDALFVPAGAAHKFVKFSHDIKLWAIFWGETGGEADIDKARN